MSLKLRLLLFIFCIYFAGFSQTNVSGIINSNTTWSLANSPYIVTGNVLVNTGVTLIIEPGVTVKVNSGLNIQSRGEIIANGNNNLRITFTSNSSTPNPGDWEGINLLDQSVDPIFDALGNYLSGTIFNYVDVSFAGNSTSSGSLYTLNADLYIDNCNISDGNSYGVYVNYNNADVTIRNCEFSNHLHAAIFADNYSGGSLEVRNSKFQNNLASGVFYNGANGLITNNLFINNAINAGAAITIYYSGSSSNTSTLVESNILSGNTRGVNCGSTSCKISRNIIMGSIEAVYNTSADIEIDSNVFANNTVIFHENGSNDLNMKFNHIYKNDLPSNSSSSLTTSSNALIVSSKNGLDHMNFDNNMISNNSLYGSALIRTHNNSNSYSINNNNIFDSKNNYIIYNDVNFSSFDIDAINNYWQIPNPVNQQIYDLNDNFNKSLVIYSPTLMVPDTNTPTSPPIHVIKKASYNSIFLSWQPNPEADVAGYKIYWGNPTGYSYDTVVDAGNVTSFMLNGVTDITAEYAVVAYDNLADGDDMDVFEGHQSWFSVSEKFSPTINTSSFNGNAISCNGASDGQITISISDGTAPYTYSWSHDSTLTSNQAPGLIAGTYVYTVSDAEGLSLTDTVVLSEPDSLQFSFTKTDILCAGVDDGVISFSALGGTAPYQYSIDGGNTLSSSSSFSSLTAGSYPLEVTDANGCFAIDTVILSQFGFLSLTLDSSSNISCFGVNDGYIAVSVANGVLPYSYSWSNGDTIEDIFNLPPTNYSLMVTDGSGCSQTISVVVSEPAILTHAPLKTDVSCFGANDGFINLNTNGGTSPYTFTWSHNSALNSESVSALIPGRYVYSITDANGCLLTDSIDIIEPAALSQSISKMDILCNGASTGQISFSASGGTSPIQYSIDGGTNYNMGSSFNGLIAGTYFTRIIDANNCFLLDTITLTEPAPLTIVMDSAANVSCNGGSDAFIATSISGGLAPYNFSWSNSTQTSKDIFGLTANSYTLTVTDQNNCSISSNFNISEPSPLSVMATTSDFNGYSISCFNAANGQISLSPTGGSSPYFYSWQHDQSLSASSLSNLDTGMYVYTVSDFNGCSFIDTVVINQPDSLTATLLVNASNCSNGADGEIGVQVSGGIAPYSFFLTDTLGNLIASSDSVSNLTPGIYNYSITDANNCSIAIPNIVLGWDHQPIVPLISAIDTVICDGTTTALSLNNGIQSVLWNDGLGGLSRSLPSGSYSVSSIDTNGCTSASDTLVIELLFAKDTTAQICLVTYDVQSGFNRIVFNKPDDESGIATYNIYKDVFGVWQQIGTVNNGDSSQFLDITSQPTSRVARYYIETEDACNVIYPKTNPAIHKTILLQSSIGSNNEVNLSWNQYEGASIWYYRILRKSNGGSFTPIDSIGSSFNTFIDNNPPLGNTSYFIEAVLNSGCSIKGKSANYNAVSTNAVQENTIGISEAKAVDQIRIFPNPTEGITMLEFSQTNTWKWIKLFDGHGKLLQEFKSRKENVSLDLTKLPKGVYFVKVELNGFTFTEKLIKL